MSRTTKMILGALLAAAVMLVPGAAVAQQGYPNGPQPPAQQPQDLTPPVVLDEAVEQPAAQVDRAQVLGVEAQRTLPVTGGDLLALTGFALALVLAGFVMVRSRRSPAVGAAATR
jgi:hypothetical protein